MKKELPRGWELVKGEELFWVIRGVSFSKNDASNRKRDGNAAILRAGNIKDNAVCGEDLIYVPMNYISDEQRLRAGDIVVAMSSGSRNVVGKAARVPETFFGQSFGAFCAVVRPKDPDISDWVGTFLCTDAYRKNISELAAGVNINNLRPRHLQDLDIPLPPLAEQRRIMAKIEALTVRSGQAREALAALPALLDRYRAAVLAAAFRGDLTAEWREEHYGRAAVARADEDPPLEFLAPLPAGWSWSSIGALGDVSGGLTKNAKRGSLRLRRPYLRVANVYADELRLDDVQEIGVTETEAARTELRAGDVLIVEGNGSVGQIGRVAMWDGSIPGCVHQNHIIKVRFADPLLSAICLRWLLSPVGRRCIEAAASSSSGLHTLSLSKVRSLPVPLPPADEQAVLLRELEEALARLPRISGVVRDVANRLSDLDAAILAKAFRGELVPQDPKDEPASVLLERIRAQRQTQPTKRRRGRRRKEVA